MGHKINPISFRLGVNETWRSKWFADPKKYRELLRKDIEIRKFLEKKLKTAAVAKIEIERSPRSVTFKIHSSRPGIIIGRGGTGIEELKKEIAKTIQENIKVDINIQEIRKPETSAALVAGMAAEQIEKRIPFRRVIKQALERIKQNTEIKGAKIMISGRLDGAEMCRRDWVSFGKIPLHTLRSNIDFALGRAETTYGIVGLRVWIYKGEIFEEKAAEKVSEKKV